MSECLAVSLDADGYQFAPSAPGDIHVFELTDGAPIRSVNMTESDPATVVLAQEGIEDYVIKSPMNGPGEIGMPVEHLDRFLDGADRSSYSVTVDEEVRSYIEVTSDE
jgi:hypothetical protein